MVPLFALAAVVLVPTVVLLLVVLPSTHRSEHWDIAWGGFDVVLALLLLAVAATAWRRSPWLEGAATAAATLLFVDAWFDVLTSSTRGELVLALVEAVFVELPLALLCLLLARSAEHHLPSTELRKPPRTAWQLQPRVQGATPLLRSCRLEAGAAGAGCRSWRAPPRR